MIVMCKKYHACLFNIEWHVFGDRFFFYKYHVWAQAYISSANRHNDVSAFIFFIWYVVMSIWRRYMLSDNLNLWSVAWASASWLALWFCNCIHILWGMWMGLGYNDTGRVTYVTTTGEWSKVILVSLTSWSKNHARLVIRESPCLRNAQWQPHLVRRIPEQGVMHLGIKDYAMQGSSQVNQRCLEMKCGLQIC